MKKRAHAISQEFGTDAKAYGHPERWTWDVPLEAFRSVKKTGLYLRQIRYYSDKEGEDTEYYHDTEGLPAIFEIGAKQGHEPDWIADFDRLKDVAYLGEIAGLVVTKGQICDGEFEDYDVEDVEGPLVYNEPNHLFVFKDADGKSYCVVSMYIGGKWLRG